jgi:hypothetical protein
MAGSLPRRDHYGILLKMDAGLLHLRKSDRED